MYTLLVAILTLIIIFLIARFIVQDLYDPAVTSTYLISQFFIGAVPLSIIAVVCELIVLAVLFFTIFSDNLSLILDAIRGRIPAPSTRLSSLQLVTVSRQNVEGQLIPVPLLKMLPLWKTIVFSVLISFFVAGTVQELAKWFIARRYRKINLDPVNAELGTQIGSNGILSISCMGALGFATSENLTYVLALSQTDISQRFPLRILLFSLLRTFLALPLHVALQFYIGLAATQNYLFEEGRSVSAALYLAIFIHGAFDAIAIVLVLLTSIEVLPDVLDYFIPGFQFFVVLLVLILCQARYRALFARERAINPFDQA